MLLRVHVQILDNPTDSVLFDDNTTEVSGTNRILTDELSCLWNMSISLWMEKKSLRI